MNEEQKVNTMNLVLDVIMLLSVFFAGVWFEHLFISSIGLFFLGVLLSQIKAVPSEEKELVKE